MTKYLGDFFIWEAVLKFFSTDGSEKANNVCFITNDTKDDWSKHGEIRVELQGEFKAVCSRKNIIGNR